MTQLSESTNKKCTKNIHKSTHNVLRFKDRSHFQECLIEYVIAFGPVICFLPACIDIELYPPKQSLIHESLKHKPVYFVLSYTLIHSVFCNENKQLTVNLFTAGNSESCKMNLDIYHHHIMI